MRYDEWSADAPRKGEYNEGQLGNNKPQIAENHRFVKESIGANCSNKTNK